MYKNQEYHKETPFARSVPEGFLPKEAQRKILLERAQEILKHLYTRECDALIFLDKSARPLSWIIKDMWRATYPETPLPKIYFLNIGGKKGTGISERLPNKPHATINKNMRDLLTKTMPETWISENALREKTSHQEENEDDTMTSLLITSALEQLDPQKNPLTQKEVNIPDFFVKNAKRIAIIDDFIYSGQAMLGAMALIKKYAPNAICEATAFFPAAEISSEKKDYDLMPWLGNKTMIGVTDEQPTATHDIFTRRYNHSRILKNIFREKIKEMTKKFLNENTKTQE